MAAGRRAVGLLCEAPDLEVRDRGPPLGRGVFARRRFARGEVVEAAPVIVCRVRRVKAPRDLIDHYFTHPAGWAVVLGYGSLYNHSYSPNAAASWDEPAGLLLVTAARGIGPGEEVTINYAGAGSADPVWFEVSGDVSAHPTPSRRGGPDAKAGPGRNGRA